MPNQSKTHDPHSCRKFPLGTVLSILAPRRLISPDGMSGIVDLLSFMTGGKLSSVELSDAAHQCAPEIIRQHPELDSAEVQFELGLLDDMLNSESGTEGPEMLIQGWLAKLITIFGGELGIRPLPMGAYKHQGPIETLRKQFGVDDGIIVCTF